MIDVVVLAAGSATRFGADKLLADVDGRSLLDITLDVVLDVVDPTRVLVVVGPRDAGRARVAATRGVRSVVAHAAARGMRWSIDAGLDAVDPDAHGALIVLADDPLAATAIEAVHGQAGRTPLELVAVRRRTPAPHPVYVPRDCRPDPPRDDADAGLRTLLASSPVRWLDLPASPSLDVDEPADITRLRRVVADERSRPRPPAAR